ncbi:hypothetical protein BXZ70DRAFT_1008438 [Cristinia sonorae]|uniref:Uncharacterized protein n=1 Tax=Cristinia sonorae TaxID=1940300 RepID=A0A8K0XQB3_9AGAR|nr:hypothetical protein BXZ70DRAFT_1008438 [Cristinia sonorae]
MSGSQIFRSVRMVQWRDSVEVVVALNSTEFPEPPPDAVEPEDRPSPSLLTGPNYLENKFFYFALAHRSPFAYDNSRYSEAFRYEYDTLPIVSSKVRGRWSYELHKMTRHTWVEFEQYLVKTAEVLDRLWTRQDAERFPIIIHPEWYEYRHSFTSERAAREAAWNSRQATVRLMGLVAFLVQLARKQKWINWETRVRQETSSDWLNWLLSSSAILSTARGERLGAFMYPYNDQEMPVCYGAKWGLLEFGAPLWLRYGSLVKTREGIYSCHPVGTLALTVQELSAAHEQGILHSQSLRQLPLLPNPPLRERTPPAGIPRRSSTPTASAAPVAAPLPPPSPEKHSGQKRGETWQEFFARRDALNAKREGKESHKDREARLQRQRHFVGGDGDHMPGAKSTCAVFRWELEDNFRIRRRVSRDLWEVEWQGRKNQRRYDSFTNEWDICTEFGEEGSWDGATSDKDLGFEGWTPAAKKPRLDADAEDDRMQVDPPQLPAPCASTSCVQDVSVAVDSGRRSSSALKRPHPGSSPSRPEVRPRQRTPSPVRAQSSNVNAPPLPPRHRDHGSRSPRPPSVVQQRRPCTPPPQSLTHVPSQGSTPSTSKAFAAGSALPAAREPSPPPPPTVVPLPSPAAQPAPQPPLPGAPPVPALTTPAAQANPHWVNPNTFGDVLTYHYGIVRDHPLPHAPHPLTDARLTLGWTDADVDPELLASATHLTMARVVQDHDLRLPATSSIRSTQMNRTFISFCTTP